MLHAHFNFTHHSRVEENRSSKTIRISKRGAGESLNVLIIIITKPHIALMIELFIRCGLWDCC